MVAAAAVERLNQGWQARYEGEIGPGGLPLSSTSQVYENARPVKSGACTLHGLSGYNSGGAQFIQIHDATSLPADGAVPKVVISVPAASNFSIEWGIVGRAFVQGIQICNSSTGPTKTIGSANCWFDAQYV